jgi:N-acetylglucosaminyldiphosphoundecaprenol N-acetyl-beta-D-mannosaminyltransferase
MAKVTAKSFEQGDVLGTKVAVTTLSAAADFVCQAVTEGRHGYVCAAPVHSIMEGSDDTSFQAILNRAIMVVPDGSPVAWSLRRQGFSSQQRVPGPDLMLEVCRLAAERGLTVGFYGSSVECLRLLEQKLPNDCPRLNITYTYSPPHRVLDADEQIEIVRDIQDSKTNILFVGLGCPKQERWMADHEQLLPCIMLGVGAAFDFHAGLLKRAPGWMQQRGLEWLYRLVSEPRRLWRRYAKHNPRFVIRTLLQAPTRRS